MSSEQQELNKDKARTDIIEEARKESKEEEPTSLFRLFIRTENTWKSQNVTLIM